MSDSMRTTWIRENISAIYNPPLMDLVFDAQIHRQFHFPNGSQSAHYDTGVGCEHLLNVQAGMAAATRSQAAGAARFCLGAAWREAPQDSSIRVGAGGGGFGDGGPVPIRLSVGRGCGPRSTGLRMETRK